MFFNKYLKYKKKYLNLKKLQGGSTPQQGNDSDIDQNHKHLQYLINLMQDQMRDNPEEKEFLAKVIKRISKIMKKEIESEKKQLQERQEKQRIQKLLQESKKKLQPNDQGYQ